ncbi:MAG TPA: ABC transporter permease [Gemmatimonadaceae bacterium]|nr:ABC transporter permease [Gemmatimonadaceae bacterium]
MAHLPPGIRRAFRLALRRPPIEEDVDTEVAFHLEMRAADLVARGFAPEAARAEAMRRFGDTKQWSDAMRALDRERAEDERRAEWLVDLRQDLRYGIRSAGRAPLFSLLAILTLALGIGANAAVFGVLKSVLLDALPYADADRLVRVYGHFVAGSDDRGPLSAGTVTDIADRQRSFASVAAFAGLPRDAVYLSDDGPRVVTVAWVEPALFTTLGVRAALGRVLRDDDAATDTVYNIVLPHATWQRMFGGDPKVLGRTVHINGLPRTVVGVMPRGFVSPAAAGVAVSEADVYFPLSLRPTLRDPIGTRRSHWLGMVGRLKPGVTVEAARRELVAIAADLAREYPKDNASISVATVPVRDAMVGDTRRPLVVLMASAALVLLITCANLAGALLSRTVSRRKEFAVRAALGAGRGRLVRQLLAESTILALAGGVAGVLLGMVGLRVLRGLALTILPEYAELSLDGGALVVCAAIALATGLTFGLAPALAASRSNVQGTLRDETRGASESLRSRRVRGLLVAGQIALCVSLLAGAGLLARSLWAMMTAPLGFDSAGALTVAVELPQTGYRTAESRLRFQERLIERLRALPGVTGVATTSALPTQVMSRNGITVEGVAPPPDDAQPFVLYAAVSDDYLRTLGIPLRRGRTFAATDGGDAPPAVVISEAMARRFWPNGDAVGKRLRMGPNPSSPWITVVGVAGDVRNDPSRVEPEPMAYGSIRQNPWNSPFVVLRTQGDPLTLVKAVQRELAAIDPTLPLENAVTLRDVVGEGLASRRLPVVLMAAFAALALLLASVGVYAMFASMTAAREREFGVRVALGAGRSNIAGLVLRQGGVWLALGLVGGALGVAVVARLVDDLLYGVRPFDPVTLGVAVGTLVACAAIALLVPVRRATRVDPIMTLR